MPRARKNGFAFALAAAEARPKRKRGRRAGSANDHVAARRCRSCRKEDRSSVGVCAKPAKALCLPLTPELRALLEDASVPKRVHDLKLALHVLCGLGYCAARQRGRHDAALLRAQPHARHAGAGRCGGAAQRQAAAIHARGRCGGDSCAGAGVLRQKRNSRSVKRVYRRN